MNIFGLTGSIGMGKTTVARIFAEHGVIVWDADDAVRFIYGESQSWNVGEMDAYVGEMDAYVGEMDASYSEAGSLLPSPGLSSTSLFLYKAGLPLVKTIVPHAVTSSGLDRTALREALQKSQEQKTDLFSRLETLIWPLIKAHLARAVLFASLQNKPMLLDAPLLFEMHLDEWAKQAVGETKFHSVVVTCPENVQRNRVLARPGMTAERLRLLLGRQMPNSEKLARADHVIDTSGTLEEVRKQVESVLVFSTLED